MPRKGEVPKRKVLPDPKFTDQTPEAYTQFVNEGGRRKLLYYSARHMEQSCLGCHNHPESKSPKKDWNVGDVVGVLKIVRPLDREIESTQRGLRGAFVLMGTIALVRAFGLGRWKENRHFVFVQAAVAVLRQPRRAVTVINCPISDLSHSTILRAATGPVKGIDRALARPPSVPPFPSSTSERQRGRPAPHAAAVRCHHLSGRSPASSEPDTGRRNNNGRDRRLSRRDH